MGMGIEGWGAIYFAMWILLPVIPAMLIYGVFPKDQIGVRGPLGALTVNATGAFAGYIITLLMMSSNVQYGKNTLSGTVRTVWTVEADVKLVDENGNEADPTWLKGLTVELRPESYEIADHFVTIILPEVNGTLPKIVLRVPDFGSEVIKPSEITAGRDEYHRVINVGNVQIKRSPTVSGGLAKTASAN